MQFGTVTHEPKALVAIGSYSRMGTGRSVERKLRARVTAKRKLRTNQPTVKGEFRGLYIWQLSSAQGKGKLEFYHH